MAIDHTRLFRQVPLEGAVEFRCGFCDKRLAAIATDESANVPVCECAAAMRYVSENLDQPVLFDVNNPDD